MNSLLNKTSVKFIGACRRVQQALEGKRPYSIVLPAASYAPWLADQEFQSVYRQIRNHTHVDVYRCYELWQLVGESEKLQGDVLEVGVWRGGSGCLIATRCSSQVYLCDTFVGVPKASARDLSYSGGEHADTSVDHVAKLVSKLRLQNVTILKGVFPDDTASQCDSSLFRFAHIDVDVYDSGSHILEWLWPRLVNSGLVVFDDYGFESCSGITQLVNEQRNRQDRVVVHNLNGHAIIVKLSDGK
jgi:O-methyltransferase